MSEPFDYEEALHAYLVVGDVHRARVEGLAGVPFFDKVTGTERVHDRRPHLHRRDGRRVPHRAARSPCTTRPSGAGWSSAPRVPRNIVVWNPWDVKAAEVPDIGDDDWERFVCIEGANAFENAVALAPGESHTTTYRVEVQPL